jgi:hypothetical protein
LRERRKITVWGAQKPMRTYTHGVIGYVLYAKRSRQEKKLAVIGGILPDVFNWLRVLDTTERSQVDQRIRHQLHAIVPLLNAFKAEQQPFELVFPCKGALDAQA